jgi:hypothetical protein
MVIDASGRLGIGMEDPQSNLHINTGGQLQIGRTTDSMYVNLTTNDLKFNRTDTGTWSYISQYGSGKGLAFTTSGGGSSNTRMVIDGNGKVGIGTATPWEKLTIQGTDEPLNIHAGGSQAILSNAYWDSGQRRWEYSQSQRKASVISFSGGGVSIQGAEEGTKDNLVTWNNGINVVSSGNVGIGTTSPTGKFEVSTDGSSHDLVVTSTGNVGIGYQNPQVELDVNGDIYVENRPIFRLSRTDCGNAESCTNWCSIIHPYVIAGGCSNSSNNYQTLKESKPIEDGTGKQGWYCHYNAKSWPDTWALCTSISVNSDDL